MNYQSDIYNESWLLTDAPEAAFDLLDLAEEVINTTSAGQLTSCSRAAALEICALAVASARKFGNVPCVRMAQQRSARLLIGSAIHEGIYAWSGAAKIMASLGEKDEVTVFFSHGMDLARVIMGKEPGSPNRNVLGISLAGRRGLTTKLSRLNR